MISLNNPYRSLLLAATAAALFGSVILLASHSQASVKPTGKPRSVLTVITVKPQQQDWPLTINVDGEIDAWQESKIGAEIGNLRVKQILVDVGANVKRGQLLAELAEETIVADLNKQRATVEKSRANLIKAQLDAQRAIEIQGSGALSKQQIDQYRTTEQTARADLAFAQAELAYQETRLAQTHIVSPDDGIISLRNGSQGDVVAAGSELFRLIRQSRIEWRAEVNAQQLAQIKGGETVELTLPNGAKVSGTVRLTGPTLAETTRNALVYVDIPKQSARPGMYLKGSIQIGKQGAWVVPQSALVLRDGREYLLMIHKQTSTEGQVEHVVSQIGIQTGRRIGDLVEIVGDIDTNTQFVASGGAFLKDGDRVSVSTMN